MFDTSRFPQILETMNAPNQALDQFRQYHELLVDWNRRVNLISRNDVPRIWERHFLDSLALIHLLDTGSEKRFLDLGTGAGFPGLPIQILRPDIEMLLLDSVRKKILFLKKVLSTLNIKSAHAMHGRAEEGVDRIGKVDVVLSRGVATAGQLLALSQAFLNPGGRIMALKGPAAASELKSTAMDSLVEKKEIAAEFVTFSPFRTMPERKYHAIVVTLRHG